MIGRSRNWINKHYAERAMAGSSRRLLWNGSRGIVAPRHRTYHGKYSPEDHEWPREFAYRISSNEPQQHPFTPTHLPISGWTITFSSRRSKRRKNPLNTAKKKHASLRA